MKINKYISSSDIIIVWNIRSNLLNRQLYCIYFHVVYASFKITLTRTSDSRMGTDSGLRGFPRKSTVFKLGEAVSSSPPTSTRLLCARFNSVKATRWPITSGTSVNWLCERFSVCRRHSSFSSNGSLVSTLCDTSKSRRRVITRDQHTQ